jgi:hypothetical protein
MFKTFSNLGGLVLTALVVVPTDVYGQGRSKPFREGAEEFFKKADDVPHAGRAPASGGVPRNAGDHAVPLRNRHAGGGPAFGGAGEAPADVLKIPNNGMSRADAVNVGSVHSGNGFDPDFKKIPGSDDQYYVRATIAKPMMVNKFDSQGLLVKVDKNGNEYSFRGKDDKGKKIFVDKNGNHFTGANAKL